jgi:hypothetical protein
MPAAAGCVVIVRCYLRKFFGDALYREPGDALALVGAVAADPERLVEVPARAATSSTRECWIEGTKFQAYSASSRPELRFRK